MMNEGATAAVTNDVTQREGSAVPVDVLVSKARKQAVFFVWLFPLLR